MKPGVDYIGVGVGAIIFNKKGKVFLAKRGKMARNEQGKWEFPGGTVEFNEKREHAIVREIREEFGFEIEPLEVLEMNDHFIPGEGQHWISTGYICKVRNGTPQIMEPDKILEIGWFTLMETGHLDLTIVSRERYETLLKKYPETPPSL